MTAIAVRLSLVLSVSNAVAKYVTMAGREGKVSQLQGMNERISRSLSSCY